MVKFFEEAEHQPMPDMLLPVNWLEVRAYCEAAARRLARRYPCDPTSRCLSPGRTRS